MTGQANPNNRINRWPSLEFSQLSQRFDAFKHSSYQRYFAARFSAAFAAQITSMSVAWQIYDETGSKVLLGLIGLAQFLPALLLVFVTGISADRFGRRLVMGTAIGVETLCLALILFMTVTGRFDAVWVLGVLVVFGAARAFMAPASASLVINLVPEKDFPNAVAWNSSSWQAASIMGPVAGGLLYGISANTAYITATLMFAFATLLIASIPKPNQRKSTDPVTMKTILGGFSFIYREKVVLGAISLDLFAVLLGGAIALLPVYARDILELGPSGLGLLRSAPGIGALIMVGVITSFPIRRHAGLIMFGGVVFFGLATAIFGFSTLTWLSIVALGFVGAADMISVYVRGTLIQLWTPDELRGRVNAVNSIFISASNELGEFRAGMMAAWIGAVPAVTLGGITAVAIAGVWAMLFPRLRQIQRLEAPDLPSKTEETNKAAT